MASRTLSAVGFAGLMLLAKIASADIINVPDDVPTIQLAIDLASDGDEVVVAPGTYNEVITFNGKAIELHSSDGANVTIIDGISSEPVFPHAPGIPHTHLQTLPLVPLPLAVSQP